MKDVFLHSHALCESTNVGEGTRVWAFAHVLPDAKIGRDCNICDHVFVENDVVVGDRVTLKCGVQLWDGLRLEDDVFIGVPSHAIVVGNPANIVGYTNTKGNSDTASRQPSSEKHILQPTSVNGVTLRPLHQVQDMRGSLSVAECGKDVPFDTKRCFLVYDVPSREVRGEHAHFKCKQFLVATRGSVRVVADDGTHREEFLLDRPNLGLYLPPMTWGIQYRYSTDAILLVLASEVYDAGDYIRDYDDFLRLTKTHHNFGS